MSENQSLEHGKEEQIPLGVADPKNQAGAWDALRQLVQGAVKEAITPTAGVKSGTVKELVAQFLEFKKPQIKPRTFRSYGQYLGWMIKHCGSISLAELSIDAIRNRSDGEEWSDTHRANTLWTVNVFLRWCGRTEQLPLPPKESRGADAVIPDAVHKRVLAETKGDFRALVQFLWLTGCRPGEATGLTAEAVNWQTSTAIIKQHKTRHKGKTRRIPLCTEALEVLRDQAEKYKQTGYLFRGLRSKLRC